MGGWARSPPLRINLPRPGINTVHLPSCFFIAIPEAAAPAQCLAALASERPRVGLAHALPAFPLEDPELAPIVAVWHSLVDECKRVPIEMVRAELPRESAGRLAAPGIAVPGGFSRTFDDAGTPKARVLPF